MVRQAILFIYCSLLQHYIVAQTGDDICPETIFVFAMNDQDFQFQIQNAEPDAVVVWNFGDETEVTDDADIQHTYPLNGSYSITATFTDVDCVESEIVMLITTVQVTTCAIALSYMEQENGLFTFTVEGQPKKYPMYWDMGDGFSIVETWVVDHIYEPGTYTVCAWFVSEFCADTVSSCIEFTYSDSINDIENYNGVVLHDAYLFPNPCNDIVTIFPQPDLGSVIWCNSIAGHRRVIPQAWISGNQLDLSQLTSGCYQLRYVSKSRDVVFRLMKQ